MFNVAFSKEEATALLQLMDLAVKAGGLQVAGAAFLLQQKISAAANAENNVNAEKTAPEA